MFYYGKEERENGRIRRLEKRTGGVNHMRILALDTGTKTGWAVIRPGWTKPEYGAEDFSLRRGESSGMRFIKFRKFLDDMRKHGVELYVYEQAHHRGGAATSVGVGLTTRVEETAAFYGVECVAVHTGELKKWATGHGKASKEMMVEAAFKLWGIRVEDDNIADALCLLALAVKRYDVEVKSIID